MASAFIDHFGQKRVTPTIHDGARTVGRFSFVDHQLADRAPLPALAFHSLILERQRDLSYASQALLHVRYEFIDARDPDHVRRTVHVERLSAAALVGSDALACLADCLDAPQVVVGLDRELRPDSNAAVRIALGLPFRFRYRTPEAGSFSRSMRPISCKVVELPWATVDPFGISPRTLSRAA